MREHRSSTFAIGLGVGQEKPLHVGAGEEYPNNKGEGFLVLLRESASWYAIPHNLRRRSGGGLNHTR